MAELTKNSDLVEMGIDEFAVPAQEGVVVAEEAVAKPAEEVEKPKKAKK